MPSFDIISSEDHPLAQHALQLIAHPTADAKHHEMDRVGTATRISSNIAITAKHVIEQYWKIYNGLPQSHPSTPAFLLQGVNITRLKKDGEGVNEPKFNIDAIQYLKSGLVKFDISSIKLPPGSDIAIMYLKSAEIFGDEIWTPPIINLSHVSLGEPVVGFGFNDDTAKDEGFDGRLAQTKGIIDRVFDDPRHVENLVRCPAVRTDARVEGGMSGGPVFDSQNDLVGIWSQSSSVSAFSDEAGYSHAVSLWPMMGHPLDGDFVEHHEKGVSTLLQMVKSGHIRARGWQNAQLVYSEEGKITGIKYRSAARLLSYLRDEPLSIERLASLWGSDPQDLISAFYDRGFVTKTLDGTPAQAAKYSLSSDGLYALAERDRDIF